jgi:hypothetical protein
LSTVLTAFMCARGFEAFDASAPTRIEGDDVARSAAGVRS